MPALPEPLPLVPEPLPPLPEPEPPLPEAPLPEPRWKLPPMLPRPRFTYTQLPPEVDRAGPREPLPLPARRRPKKVGRVAVVVVLALAALAAQSAYGPARGSRRCQTD